MKLSEFKKTLAGMSLLHFIRPDGNPVPAHFHITEAGRTTKEFIDCGGTLRKEQSVNFQLWVAQDTDHRLEPKKLLDIISLAEEHFGNEDLELEVEYQSETIGRYGIGSDGMSFFLLPKQTDCLAPDRCGVPVVKQPRTLSSLTPAGSSCCTPGSNCC